MSSGGQSGRDSETLSNMACVFSGFLMIQGVRKNPAFPQRGKARFLAPLVLPFAVLLRPTQTTQAARSFLPHRNAVPAFAHYPALCLIIAVMGFATLDRRRIHAFLFAAERAKARTGNCLIQFESISQNYSFRLNPPVLHPIFGGVLFVRSL